METSFLELKQKEVVNLVDGKRMGRVCDVVFSYPEGRVLGIVSPGGRGFRFGKGDAFIDLKSVKKVGVDVVLVEIRTAPKQDKKKGRYLEETTRQDENAFVFRADRRDYGEYE